jgi:hypothetical protein
LFRATQSCLEPPRVGHETAVVLSWVGYGVGVVLEPPRVGRGTRAVSSHPESVAGLELSSSHSELVAGLGLARVTQGWLVEGLVLSSSHWVS